MASAMQRPNPIQLLWRRLLMFGLLLVLLAGSWGAWGVYGKEQESAALRAQAEGRLAELQDRHDSLLNDIDALESDRGKEEVMRDTQDVGKPGEGLIVIVDPQASTDTVRDQADPAPENSIEPWWKFW